MSPETARQAVARHAKRAREATKARDAAIEAMYAEGASLRDIGEAADVSYQTVKNILKRRGVYKG